MSATCEPDFQVCRFNVLLSAVCPLYTVILAGNVYVSVSSLFMCVFVHV